jgi:hypothetical protein
MSEKILFGEPQCWDYEHAGVNASLMQTALLAYPDCRIVFLSEEQHQSRVRELLANEASSLITRIEWRQMAIPPRQARSLKRLWKEWSAVRRILTTASREEFSLVFVTSATEIGFLLLKIHMSFSRAPFPVLAVLHGVLATVVPGATRKRLASVRGMRLAFRLPHPRRLWYLAYGSSILRSLREIDPEVATHTIDLEIPFPWAIYAPPPTKENAPRQICFGWFGASGGRGKGFDRFVLLVERIRALRTNATFTIVGHLSTDDNRDRYRSLFPEASPTPLSRETYVAYASQVTYAVSLGDPEVYKLSASTSFLDALSFIKPGIYLRNAYIEECFSKMGDIGYLCDSADEVFECMIGILDKFPAARYAAQCKNILNMRRIFEPSTIAKSLRKTIGSLREIGL